MLFFHRSIRLPALVSTALLLAACSPQSQTSPLTASAIEPARIDAPLATPPVESAPLDVTTSPTSSYPSSAAQRRFERKQRGCQAEPVPDECIN